MRFARLIPAAVALLVSATAANAAVNYTGGAYFENFDSLATAPTAANTAAIAWTNDTTLTGWSLFAQPAPGVAIPTYIAGNGSSNAGSFYSYGTPTSTDRALGGLGSAGAYFGAPAAGAVAGWIAVALQNNSGSAFSSFTVGFNGEQWRNGGNATLAAQTMVMEYGFGASFASVSSWTAPGAAFNWSTLVNSATAGAVDGNGAGLVAGVGGTVNTTWNAGQTLWIRFIENNDAGNDHGLALDNFNFSAASVAAVPEPQIYALMIAGLGLIGFAARRRKQ
jgi:hypothetical protein